MKHIALYSLLFICLLLTACPASTDNPIDQGSYDVPTWLIGKWTTTTQNLKEDYRIEKGKKKGQCICYELDSLGNVKETYDPIILSSIENQVFLSANIGGRYSLFKLKKLNDRSFDLEEVDDLVVEGGDLAENASSDVIKGFLRKNVNNDAIFGAVANYTKF